ncbi:uncharacterized protein LOC108915458 [Anoplophora glabripennis]|uniref:uncharacterized protein LOC108915458 n=1 Tax=Anoplophora glabripennis TaxID=217634 RepID=UPI000875A79B|nr:uncharacterized protein LOC108915458 [Anoplophora glabripennis]
MKFYKEFIGCLSLWCVLASTSAEPSICYYCTTDADGTACNSPLDESGIRVQYCGNSTVTTDVGTAKEIASTSTTQGTYVCTTSTYTSNLNNFVTIRECQSRQIEGVDICSYLSGADITNMYSRDFSCQTCDSDLCNNDNSRATVHFSTVAFIGIALVKLFV